MVTITSVIERPKTHLFVITDSKGGKYATRNAWLASLAEQYQKAQTPVILAAFSGWYYDELQDVRPDLSAEQTA